MNNMNINNSTNNSLTNSQNDFKKDDKNKVKLPSTKTIITSTKKLMKKST